MESNSAQLVEFNNFEEVKRNFVLNKVYKFLPYKEDWYIKKRYFNHPIYRYRVWGIVVNEVCLAPFIWSAGRAWKCKDYQIC